MNIVYGAFADEYAVSLEEQIEGLIQNKIDYLEIRFVDGKNIADIDLETVKRLNETLKENGISVFSIGSPIGKIDITDDFNEHLVKLERICESANIFGSKYIRMFSFYNRNRHPIEEFRKTAFERVEKLLELADRYGVTLCHENEEGIYGESPEDCLELFESFEGRLRCVFDMGNFILAGYYPLQAYKMLCGYIEYFHIKDGTKDGRITVPGYGQARIKEIVKDFAAKKEVVHVTLEPHLMSFVGLDRLTEGEFKREVSFKSNKEAFNFAAENLKRILS